MEVNQAECSYHCEPSGCVRIVCGGDDGHCGSQLGHPEGGAAADGEGDDCLGLRNVRHLRKRKTKKKEMREGTGRRGRRERGRGRRKGNGR